MSSGRRPRSGRGAVLLVVLPCLLALAGCTRASDGEPAAGATASLPSSPEELEDLIVRAVPSGLPRLPDDELEPPAGAKRLADVATYADDPARERAVLDDYGYRFGWERFWGTGTGPMTAVFVDRFDGPAGAAAYAEDLARNDAEHYGAELDRTRPDLPDGCRMLTVETPEPGSELTGPAALAWCGHGVFSVGATAMAGSIGEAQTEVRAVLGRQLDRLPAR